MSKVVLDTSALLAYLFEEKGADVVASVLEEGLGVIGSANYAELVSKLIDKGIPTDEVATVIDSLELEFVDQDEKQARQTGELRLISRSFGLSLGDRACLALGAISELPVMTADKVWKDMSIELDIQIIR